MSPLALTIIKPTEVWPFFQEQSTLGTGVLIHRHPVLNFLFLGKMLGNAENSQL